MSNKVLWLDRGNQICFSERIDEVCDAYEEFLITKTAPANKNEIRNFAENYRKRLAEQRAERDKTEQDRILDILKKGDHSAAVVAARKFLRE